VRGVGVSQLNGDDLITLNYQLLGNALSMLQVTTLRAKVPPRFSPYVRQRTDPFSIEL
jgi:hypothetical protein